MNATEEKIWHAIDSESDARPIQGRPVHAFWPVLAPSFRWVLLPPHRRTGGTEIAWEWRAGPSAPDPTDADLADLRLRLRDGLDLFGEELRRRPSLPEGLSAEELRRGVEAMLHDLRHGPDTRLAAHAVFTTQHGWMIRSWGVAAPAPAQVEGARTAPDPRPGAPSPEDRPAPTRTAGPARSAVRARYRAALVLLLLVSSGIALWLRLRVTITRSSSVSAMPAPAATPTPKRTSPRPRSPALDLSDSFATPDPAGSGASKPSPPTAHPAKGSRHASPPPGHAAEIATTPLAIAGRPSSSPEARVAQAGPPSRLPGKDEDLPPIAVPSGGARADAPDAQGDAPDAPPSPPPPPGATGDAAPLPATRGAPPRPPPVFAETREGKLAPSPLAAIIPAPSSVEAREAPGAEKPAPEAPSLTTDGAGAAAERASSPREAAPRTREASAAPTPPPGSAERQASDASARRAPAASASPALEDLRLVFGSHAMPWRLTLERDTPLPTRPVEGNGEAEMRAARIAAWAEARARVPLAFRRQERRVGWNLRLSPEAAAPRPLRWRDGGGDASPVGANASVGDAEAWIGWREAAETDVDALLLDADGKTLARVRRRVARNEIEVVAAPAVAELRPWFALRLKPGAGDEGVTAPAGWTVRIEQEELVARGPAGALRMRWEHAATGWCLQGGWARATP